MYLGGRIYKGTDSERRSVAKRLNNALGQRLCLSTLLSHRSRLSWTLNLVAPGAPGIRDPLASGPRLTRELEEECDTWDPISGFFQDFVGRHRDPHKCVKIKNRGMLC